jgi:hypothetical protein
LFVWYLRNKQLPVTSFSMDIVCLKQTVATNVTSPPHSKVKEIKNIFCMLDCITCQVFIYSKKIRSVVRNIATFEAPLFRSCTIVQYNSQNQKKKPIIIIMLWQKLLDSITECGKEFENSLIGRNFNMALSVQNM